MADGDCRGSSAKSDVGGRGEPGRFGLTCPIGLSTIRRRSPGKGVRGPDGPAPPPRAFSRRVPEIAPPPDPMPRSPTTGASPDSLPPVRPQRSRADNRTLEPVLLSGPRPDPSVGAFAMTQLSRPALSPLAARRMLQLACLGIGLSLPIPGIASTLQDPPSTRPAQDATQPAGQRGEVPEALLRLVDDFYHYATVGNYTAAQAYGEQLLAGNYDPEQVLDAFTEIQERRGPEGKPLDQRLLEWQNAEEISAVATEITRLINEGRIARATNPEFVAEQLERLNGGALAYRNALEQLRNSAEYAVPVMIRYLTDPQKAQFHADIRRAMRDLGVDMLNPLWAATEMEDPQVLASLLI